MPHLDNWALVHVPQLGTTHLMGTCTGHHNAELNGDTITTSAVLSFDPVAKTAETRSGSQYTLGEPNPEFIAFLTHHGRKIEEFKIEPPVKEEAKVIPLFGNPNKDELLN